MRLRFTRSILTVDRRKGWSEAKIERALSSKIEASSRPSRHQTPNEDGAYWVSLLSDIMKGLSQPSVGLMHHFYTRAPGAETFKTAREVGGNMSHAAEVLAKMQDGKIYDFRA